MAKRSFSIAGSIRDLSSDRHGTGAIEFAILFPVLVMLYLGAFEATLGLDLSRRTSRAADQIADLVSRQKDGTINKAWLTDMPAMAKAIYFPFPVEGMALKITGIKVDGPNAAKVDWSWTSGPATADVKNSNVSLPAELSSTSGYLVRAQISMPYSFFTFNSSFMPDSLRHITITRVNYYRARLGSSLSCTDC